jgi:hypothetical protein
MRRSGGTTAGPSPFQIDENRRYFVTLFTAIGTGTIQPVWALCRRLRFQAEISLSPGHARWQPWGKRKPRGDVTMYLTRRIDVLAIFAAFAFVGAVLLGMF